MKFDSDELTEYVSSVLKGIQASENANVDFSLTSGVTFDLSVIHKKEAGGGIKILIADAEGKYEKQVVSRITFTMNSKKGMASGISTLRDVFETIKNMDKT